jgi:hypothetical protein
MKENASERSKRAWKTIRKRNAMKKAVQEIVEGVRVTEYSIVEDKNQIAIIIKK